MRRISIAAALIAASTAAAQAQPDDASERLYRGYQRFAFVRWCHDVRQGYLVQYVNDADLERAKLAIKAVAAQIAKENATLDTDHVWKQALRSLDGQYEHEVTCRGTLAELIRMSPVPVYSVAKP